MSDILYEYNEKKERIGVCGHIRMEYIKLAPCFVARGREGRFRKVVLPLSIIESEEKRKRATLFTFKPCKRIFEYHTQKFLYPAFNEQCIDCPVHKSLYETSELTKEAQERYFAQHKR